MVLDCQIVPRRLIIYKAGNQSVFMRGFEWLAVFVIIFLDIDVPIMRAEHGVGKERYHNMYQVPGSSMIYLFELKFASSCLLMVFLEQYHALLATVALTWRILRVLTFAPRAYLAIESSSGKACRLKTQLHHS